MAAARSFCSVKGCQSLYLLFMWQSEAGRVGVRTGGVFLLMEVKEWALSFGSSFMGWRKRGSPQCLGHVNLSVWSFSHMTEIRSSERERSCVSSGLLPLLSHMFVLLMIRKRRRRRGRARECRKGDTCRSVPLRVLDTWGMKMNGGKVEAFFISGWEAGWVRLKMLEINPGLQALYRGCTTKPLGQTSAVF